MSQTPSRVFRPVPVPGPARFWFFLLLAVLGLPLVWLLFTLLQAPKISYRIESGVLTVSSSLGSSHQEKRIQLARVTEARPEWLREGSLRFGTEKPGYCVGFFAYPRLGEVWQVSDCSETAVVIVAGGEVAPVAVTPSDRDAFLKALWAGTPGTFTPPAKRSGSWWFTLFVVIAVLVVLVAALLTVFFFAPARLRYTVGNGALEVATLLKRRRIPLAGVRAHTHRPLLGARLSGVPLPGYHVGSWLFDTMATTVFASVRDDGVLLEGEGRFFLSPHDPEGFLAALGEHGAKVIDAPQLQRRR